MQFSQSLEDSVLQGKRKRGKWITATAAIVSVAAIYLALNIGRSVYYNNLGTNHLAEGEYDQAIACFNKALKAKRKFPEALCNRGSAYYEKNQYDEAIPDFDRAIELNPDFSEAYHGRAMVYYYQKQYDRAWDDVNKAHSLGHPVSSNLVQALREATGRQY